MEAILFLCSESAAIDARTNNLSVFHVMEELNAVSFPVLVQRFAVIMLLSRTQDEPQNPALHLRITLGEQNLFEGPLTFSFQQHLRARTVADLFGLVIPAPGDVSVDARVDDQPLAHWTIKVNRVGQLGLNVFPPMPLHAPPTEPARRD